MSDTEGSRATFYRKRKIREEDDEVSDPGSPSELSPVRRELQTSSVPSSEDNARSSSTIEEDEDATIGERNHGDQQQFPVDHDFVPIPCEVAEVEIEQGFVQAPQREDQQLLPIAEAIAVFADPVYQEEADLLDEDGDGDEEDDFDDAEDLFFDAADDQDPEPQRQHDRDPDPPLYDGSPISLKQSLLAILTFSLVHNLTGAALSDLLGLISLHCIAQNNLLKDTLYEFKKYFQDMDSPVKFHFYCSNCFSTLNSRTAHCVNENCPPEPDRSVCYFLEVSIISQLANLFKREGFSEKLAYRRQRVKKNDLNYEDIYDGKLYSDKITEGYFNRASNISFLWNTDGVSIYKSAKFSIWPFYLVVNELPYSIRFKSENVITAGLWFGRTKPALPLFTNAFYDDLSQLYQGVDFQLPNNEPVTVRGVILCGTCDLPAKAHMLNVMSYQGYFGCPVCKIRGERTERTDEKHAYPFENAPLRTDNETAQHAALAEAHNLAIFGVKGWSGLRLYIPNYITATAIDIMHCVFEGVVKKLLKLSFDSEFSVCFP